MIEKFKEIDTHEIYRYFHLKELSQKEYQTRAFEAKVKEASEIVFEDGVLVSLPKEVTLKKVSSYKVSQNHFDPLYELSHENSKEICFFEIQKSCSIKIVHRFLEPKSLFSYRYAFEVAEGVEVEIEEKVDGGCAKESLFVGGFDLLCHEEATVSYSRFATHYQDGCVALFSNAIELKQKAKCHLHTFDFGFGQGLASYEVGVAKEADANLYHLLFTKEKAEVAMISQIIHKEPNATSSQVAKTIVDDNSRAIVDALIRIEEAAKGAKAHQNAKAIILQDGAFVISKPQLEIYIDDVEASHGSTIGELDEEQLFYLRSRGISYHDAKKMLIIAFVHDMIEQIGSQKIQDRIENDFEKFYLGHIELECMKSCHGCEEIVLKDEKWDR